VTCNKKKKTQAVDFNLFCPDCSCNCFFVFRSVNFCLLSSSQLAVLSFFSWLQVWRLGGSGADDLHSCWLTRRLGLLLEEEGVAAWGEGVVGEDGDG
jgi:hypothetical protein